MLHAFHPLYALTALVVGLTVGFTGVGGGALMTPILVLAFGVDPSTAVGTDLLLAGLTRIGGAAVHGRNGAVDWRLARRLALGSAPAAALTLLALAHFGGGAAAKSHLVTSTLGAALIATALTLLFRRRLIGGLGRALERVSERTLAVLTIGLGVVLGVLVTGSSVGAGAIGVTAMLTLYPRMPAVRLVGTDIAHGAPLALIAGLGHWRLGSVDLALLATLLAGSIPGAMIGSHFAARAPDRVLRPVMAGALALVGGRMVF
jgi:uncharacterized membrane protein YfcA